MLRTTFACSGRYARACPSIRPAELHILYQAVQCCRLATSIKITSTASSRNCGFTTLLKSVGDQWHELDEHCKSMPRNEHAVLRMMLQQSYCAQDNCNQLVVSGNASRKARAFFAHERLAHGTLHTCDICSFVRLAREGHVVSGIHRKAMPECEKIASFRMLEKIQALPQTTVSIIFEKNGCPNPNNQTFQGKITTDDPLQQLRDKPPLR